MMSCATVACFASKLAGLNLFDLHAILYGFDLLRRHSGQKAALRFRRHGNMWQVKATSMLFQVALEKTAPAAWAFLLHKPNCPSHNKMAIILTANNFLQSLT